MLNALHASFPSVLTEFHGEALIPIAIDKGLRSRVSALGDRMWAFGVRQAGCEFHLCTCWLCEFTQVTWVLFSR